MGLAENIKISVYDYWMPKEIKQFSEDVISYNVEVLEHPNQAPIVQLESLEKRARELHNKYYNGTCLGVVSGLVGLALYHLDWMYNLKPEIIEKLATPLGFLIAIAGMIHAVRRQSLCENYVEGDISSAERITIYISGR